MRHLVFFWMNLIFSPPAPTTSFTLWAGICRGRGCAAQSEATVEQNKGCMRRVQREQTAFTLWAGICGGQADMPAGAGLWTGLAGLAAGAMAAHCTTWPAGNSEEHTCQRFVPACRTAPTHQPTWISWSDFSSSSSLISSSSALGILPPCGNGGGAGTALH